MFPSVDFVRDGDLLDVESQGDSDSQQYSKDHFLIALVDFLVFFRIYELLVVFGEVLWGVCDKPDVLCLIMFYVLLRGLIEVSINW